jgi:hypothetical protein
VGEYRKRRVTVSAVEAVDALCACINELSGKLSVSPNLFVLVLDDDVVAKFHKTVSIALSEAVRKRVCLVSRRRQKRSANGIQDTSDRWLTTDLVRNFETWMDRRSARRVHDHLDAGQCIIFVQVSNNNEESDVYRIVERFCVGSVQQHDLPVWHRG